MLETGEKLVLRVRPSNHYDDLSIDKWARAYLHVVANAQLKLMRRALMYQSEAAAIARQMELHIVDAYKGLNQVERQLRKKAGDEPLIIHVTNNAYLSFSHIALFDMNMDLTRTYVMQMTRAIEQLLPFEIDDEFITDREILEQPPGRLSLVAGLNAMTKGNVNLMQASPSNPAYGPRSRQSTESDSSPASQGVSYAHGNGDQQSHALSLVEEQLTSLERCLDDLPMEISSVSVDSRSYTPPARSEPLSSQYQAMRVNIHVTHLWAQNALADQMRASLETTLHGEASRLMEQRCCKTQERVARQLLDLLHTLPTVNLLPNGNILVSSLVRSTIPEPRY